MNSIEYSKEVGRRIRAIREIFNEGGRISTTQFAYLLGETRDIVNNYENGRTNLNASTLLSMYYRGINPVFIISGDEDIFANNSEGRRLRSVFGLKGIDYPGKKEKSNKIHIAAASEIPKKKR